jgi:hypothetical protein
MMQAARSFAALLRGAPAAASLTSTSCLLSFTRGKVKRPSQDDEIIIGRPTTPWTQHVVSGGEAFRCAESLMSPPTCEYLRMRRAVSWMTEATGQPASLMCMYACMHAVALMAHPKYNKGMAFTDSERDALHIRGMLPHAVLSQEVQVERTLNRIRTLPSDLERHNYLLSLQERNEHLFFR